MIKAVTERMMSTGANLGGSYPSALETIQAVARARETVATFFNCSVCEVVLGANMTSLTNHIARSIGRVTIGIFGNCKVYLRNSYK